MKYTVGNRVTIKSLEWYNQNKDEHNYVDMHPYGFNEPMASYCGKEAIIVEVIDYIYYRINLDGNQWKWTDNMFENSKFKYNIGDKVRIRDAEWYREPKYKNASGYINLPEGMSQYSGKEAIITSIEVIDDGVQFYRLDIDNEEYRWSDLMFDIKEVKRWKDLDRIEGFFLDQYSKIHGFCHFFKEDCDINIARTEAHCRAMLAMAMISQLKPHYGGDITEVEWADRSSQKHYIYWDGYFNKFDSTFHNCSIANPLVTFHTSEQAQEFIEHNQDLLNDYFMINTKKNKHG